MTYPYTYHEISVVERDGVSLASVICKLIHDLDAEVCAVCPDMLADDDRHRAFIVVYRAAVPAGEPPIIVPGEAGLN